MKKAVHLTGTQCIKQAFDAVKNAISVESTLAYYDPTKEFTLQVVDALSRLSLEKDAPVPDLNVQIHDICPRFSSECLQKFQGETPKDPEFAAFEEVVFNGWLVSVRDLPLLVRTYWNY